MLSVKSVLECKIGDRMYQLICNSDSPLGELHDALAQMKGYTIERIVDANKEVKDEPKEVKDVEVEAVEGT